MRSTIFIASIFAILFAGVFAEVPVDQPILIQDQASIQTPVEVPVQGEVIDGVPTEEELLQNNFAVGATIPTPIVTADQGTFVPVAEPIVRTEAEIPTQKVVTPEIVASTGTNFRFVNGEVVQKSDVTSGIFRTDIIRPIVTPTTTSVRPVIATTTDARRTAEGNFVFVEEPTVVIPAITRSDISSKTVIRPRVVEVVRKSVDSRAQSISQPIDVDRFFEVLQPAAPSPTASVDIVRPIRVTEPVPSVVSGQYFEIVRPTRETEVTGQVFDTTSQVPVVEPVTTQRVVLSGRTFGVVDVAQPISKERIIR